MEAWKRAICGEIRRSARVVVLGIGHTARGDDAAGNAAARLLLDGPAPLPAKALVVAAEEAPENFTGLIRAFGPDLTVILDAAQGGRTPGTIFLVEPAAIADDDLSTHKIPLIRLVRYIRETMAGRVLLLGIEPGTLEGEEEGRMSPPVDQAVRAIARTLRRALAE
jgi:hydrogenase maturation protease